VPVSKNLSRNVSDESVRLGPQKPLRQTRESSLNVKLTESDISMNNESKANCACARVEYSPRNHANGTLSARWACHSCGSEFVPKRVSDELAAALGNASSQREVANEAATAICAVILQAHKVLDEAGIPKQEEVEDPALRLLARAQLIEEPEPAKRPETRDTWKRKPH